MLQDSQLHRATLVFIIKKGYRSVIPRNCRYETHGTGYPQASWDIGDSADLSNMTVLDMTMVPSKTAY